MGKTIRQNKIIEIISTNEIDTQEELADILNSYDFNVTQATVSRDIKEMGLIKIAGKIKKYKYALSAEVSGVHNEKFINLFKNSVISIENAQNLVVVKTLGGNGNSAGVVVDKLKMEEIVGCVAGDDTLLIVTKNDDNAVKVVETLKNLL